MKGVSPHRIKDYCFGIYDGPHATPQEAQDGPVFLGIKNITDDGRLDFSEIRHVSEEEFPRWTRRIVPQPDDVVFTYEATLHRYAIIPDGFRGCLGRRVALVRPDPDKIDSRYLLYYFLSARWRAVVQENVITGATVDRIPLERFPDFPASFPPVDVQRRIAGILSHYDDLIENNRRRTALLEEAARQLYREWFVRLRFPGHEHTRVTNGVPEGWERVQLGDQVMLNYGKALKADDRVGGPFPVYGSSGVIGTHEAALVQGPGIILGRKGNVGSVFGHREIFSLLIQCILWTKQRAIYGYIIRFSI
jgi:type I restriction enzyme S subunit